MPVDGSSLCSGRMESDPLPLHHSRLTFTQDPEPDKEQVLVRTQNLCSVLAASDATEGSLKRPHHYINKQLKRKQNLDTIHKSWMLEV